MPMHEPPHPGEFISKLYLEVGEDPEALLAAALDLPHVFVARLLKGQEVVTPALAAQLAKGIGRTPESWIAMQCHYDEWAAMKHKE